MNRRKLLGGMLSLPVAGILSSCKDDHEENRTSGSKGTLKVILHGPFGVVLKQDEGDRVTAYVPFDPDQQKLGYSHELRFPDLSHVVEGGREKAPNYNIQVLDEGLEKTQGVLRVDQGFYDFNLPHIGKWRLPSEYFVAVELPRPDYITFTPPAEPLFFGGQLTLQPIDHILEYRISNPDEVRVKRGDKVERPLPCSELLKQCPDAQRQHQKRNKVYQQGSQMTAFEEMLGSCSSSDLCLFIGAGLDPKQTAIDETDHGIYFFNNVLLPSFAPELKKRLQKVGNCSPAMGDLMSSPTIMPAELRYQIPSPRFLEVSSTVDCQAGGIMGRRP